MNYNVRRRFPKTVSRSRIRLLTYERLSRRIRFAREYRLTATTIDYHDRLKSYDI